MAAVLELVLPHPRRAHPWRFAAISEAELPCILARRPSRQPLFSLRTAGSTSLRRVAGGLRKAGKDLVGRSLPADLGKGTQNGARTRQPAIAVGIEVSPGSTGL